MYSMKEYKKLKRVSSYFNLKLKFYGYVFFTACDLTINQHPFV